MDLLFWLVHLVFWFGNLNFLDSVFWKFWVLIVEILIFILNWLSHSDRYQLGGLHIYVFFILLSIDACIFCLIWKQILMFWKLGLFFIDFSSESFIGQSVVFRRLKRNIKALSALITYLVLINSVCRYVLEGSLSFIQQIINVIGENSRVKFFSFSNRFNRKWIFRNQGS